MRLLHVCSFRSLPPSLRILVPLLAALLLMPLAPGAVPAASAAELPLGKANYAMAVGGLRTTSTQNWGRLGQYTFATDGTVSEQHWHWTQRERVTRSSIGIQAAGCTSRDCVVQTANGYQSTGASETLHGEYTVTGDTVRITWDGGLYEEWTLTPSADGALVTTELGDNNFGATHGYGNGSNAAWSARVPMSEIAALDHSALVHRYDLWKTTTEQSEPYIDHGDGNPFWIQDWNVCDGGQCLGAESANPSQYYVAPAREPTGHRRDTLWHWVRALADGRDEWCYTGNSHVKPMIQVIDDNGDFHGWVGVEASLNQTTSEGALADDIGVFRILG
ncbi:hypothetical protein [Streptomyces sp. B6B3]|uniref:hypothetical protein n=1 Tax=Streptomyces sp. B6B3 TaxID=3153570 RepID=UPI00325D830E